MELKKTRLTGDYDFTMNIEEVPQGKLFLKIGENTLWFLSQEKLALKDMIENALSNVTVGPHRRKMLTSGLKNFAISGIHTHDGIIISIVAPTQRSNSSLSMFFFPLTIADQLVEYLGSSNDSISPCREISLRESLLHPRV
jgi:hypothetical protein